MLIGVCVESAIESLKITEYYNQMLLSLNCDAVIEYLKITEYYNFIEFK